TRPAKLSQNGLGWLIVGNKIAGRTSVSPPRNAVRTLSPPNEFLRRAEAAQRVQSRDRLHRRRLGALSRNRSGVSGLRHSALDTAGPARTSNKSIAVLPFDNLSRDPDNAYFCEGVQDEILTRLAKVADLKVISRTSTQHFKSTPENLPQIAKQLGVAHILEG